MDDNELIESLKRDLDKSIEDHRQKDEMIANLEAEYEQIKEQYQIVILKIKKGFRRF